MKCVYWLVPCIATTLFATYYHQWFKQTPDDRVFSCPVAPGLPGSEYAGRNGHDEAEADWARGARKYLTYGLPIHWIGEFGEILKRDYRVELRAVAGCVVDAPLVNYVDAYDAVVERHMKEEYGDGCLTKAEKAADALYTERHPRPEATAPRTEG